MLITVHETMTVQKAKMTRTPRSASLSRPARPNANPTPTRLAVLAPTTSRVAVGFVLILAGGDVHDDGAIRSEDDRPDRTQQGHRGNIPAANDGQLPRHEWQEGENHDEPAESERQYSAQRWRVPAEPAVIPGGSRKLLSSWMTPRWTSARVLRPMADSDHSSRKGLQPMGIISRGFSGRRREHDAAGAAPDPGLSRPVGRTNSPGANRVGVHDLHGIRPAASLGLGRVDRAPDGRDHGRPALRDPMVRSSAPRGGACRWTPCLRTSKRRLTTPWCIHTAATTNLPVDDLLEGKAWMPFATTARIAPAHGGPARLLVPHLPLEEREVGARYHAERRGRAGILGECWVPQLRRPVARTAVLGRMSWRVAAVAALHDQSRTARSIVLVVPGWPGHDAGQHVDVRLTAPDGYSAVRSYSIASAVDADRIELTVEQLPDGEVSPIWRASCSSATSWRSAARSVGGSCGGPTSANRSS